MPTAWKTTETTEKQKCIVVCGPTASGKSRIADGVAGEFDTSAILVDSMQVYREIPTITNQDRSRPARLGGMVPIEEPWSVAQHRDAVLGLAAEDLQRKGIQTPIILDAGTGMYLNAILFDIELALRVPTETRREAETLSRGASNPRRKTRERELEISGAGKRGSIWDGEPRFDTRMYYLRPEKVDLDAWIHSRSRTIAERGIPEARLIQEAEKSLPGRGGVSAQVAGAIGVRELRSVVGGAMSLEEARERMEVRTRQLSRRQMTWFDKLSRVAGRKGIVVESFTDYAREPDALVRRIVEAARGSCDTAGG